MSYRIGVDVGGTFTDVLLIESGTSKLTAAKVPSTPKDLASGVLAGIAKACQEAGITPSEVTHVLHGTTVATNAVLTGGGARVGLIVTKGFRDVLQIARSHVPGDYGAWVVYKKSDPMAPVEMTFEVDERVSAQGEVLRPLDEESVLAAARALKDKDIEALTICLINSYAFDGHERRVRELVKSVLPGVPISISSEVVPEMQEYERTLTTVANSYVHPVVQTYIEGLESELDASMPGAQLRILKSDGGLVSAERAADYPVSLLMSGPAGGVAGAVWVAEQAGYRDIITFDVGGTSTDVALVQDGKPQLRRETMIGDVSVRASSIDVRTVGAGGGSIASVPEVTRALRVGPQSAGAEPGPAAYGRGGTEPTVTDANVVLGALPTDTRLGGEMVLDRDAAVTAVGKIAAALDLSVEDAAAGIIDIVNENMYGALRLVSLEQGYDPKDFALVAFGGAGPLHANAIGKLLRSWPVVIPRSPGVLCAYGDVTTRVRQESSRTFVRQFATVDLADVRQAFAGLEEIVREALDSEGVPSGQQQITLEADIRYSGQSDAITVPVAIEELTAEGIGEVTERFDQMHEHLNTFRMDTLDREFLNLRAIGLSDPMTAGAEALPEGNGDPGAARIGEVDAYLERVWHRPGVYDRTRLLAGDRLVGPAIVQEMDSTTVILADHVGTVDRVGNIIINPQAHEETTTA
ncbi:MAG: 5-oxoprolinase [Cryptosporangiaceae bacterium]|jgi:N-methylhydantoinase A|nr:5-oxoprolinase [Cryptosporangiaceae bacterium]